VAFANHVLAEELTEEPELGIAGCPRFTSNSVDRAVVFAQAQCSVLADVPVGQVAGLVLEDRELSDAIGQPGVRRQPRRELLLEPMADLATAGREDVLDEIGTADVRDCREQPGREAVVVRGEETLRIRRDVVEMAGPADAMALGRMSHEIGGLERVELLEDPGAAREEGSGESVG
jgi:hypothetical protein